MSELDLRGPLPADTAPAAAGESEPDGPGGRRRGEDRSRWSRLAHQARQPESIITLLVVAACSLFTFVQLQPSKLFLDSTPAGGDMGAHVWLPAYVKDHLLPHLRVTGWTPDWYAGFPALTYYFPLPIFLIAAVSYVLPYNIAFKLVSVLGLVTLPIAAWAFGRLSRMPFPGPACLAAATLPYLFSRDFTIYGGNIASTMAGEFSFSISLSLALVFLGLVARGLDTGKLRALAAVVLFAAALSHILPTFFAVGGAIVLTVMRWDRHRLRWIVPTLAIGGLLSAFWSLPFEWRLPYATNMGYQKLTTYLTSLFPDKDLWLFLLAAVGFLLAIINRRRVGIFLGIMTVLAALAFRVAPQARLWNARVLPFWFLCLYLLAGVAFAEAGGLIAEAVTAGRSGARSLHGSPTPVGARSVVGAQTLVPIPVVTLLVSLAWVCFPLHLLPFGHTSATTGSYRWLGISSRDTSFIPSWVRWNYSGYQSPGKARRNEYFALVAKMKQLGQSTGCGRAMWEYEPELDQMGTPDALMLLPYWTDGCIGSMEGLYYESSATTPYHFLNAAELSAQPSNPVRGLDYPTGPDVAEGVQHLQMMGVRYFMAISPQVEAQADADSSLQLVASVGPYPVSYTTGNTTSTQQRTWKIYQVSDAQVVEPLINQPVVMKGVSGGGSAWLTASESWYLDPNRWDVYEAATGPSSWARVSPTDTDPPRTSLPPVQVSGISERDDSVSFTVDTTGVPILVKTSYFPNWHVSGAKGVYRVAPNLMVVIPTSDHVRLSYGYTPVDWIGFLLTLLGIAGVVMLWRLRPVLYPAPLHRFSPGGPDHAEADTAQRLGEAYRRLEQELGEADSGGLRGSPGDLDVWLGQPGGLDLARYYASGWALPTGEHPDPGSAEAAATQPATPEIAATDPADGAGPHQNGRPEGAAES